jgi:hypothetical protein
MDGNVKYPTPNDPFNPQITWPGYGQPWLDRIVAETGDRYSYPKKGAEMRRDNAVDSERIEGTGRSVKRKVKGVF